MTTQPPQVPLGARVHRLFNANTIGFSHQFISELLHDQPFPKYSIHHENAPWRTILEVALAGYGPGNVDVSWDAFSLHITSKNQEGDGPASTNDENDEETKGFQYNGIARRGFQLRFLLGPDVQDVYAWFRNGMLTVEIDYDATKLYYSKSVEIGDCPKASQLKASAPLPPSKLTSVPDNWRVPGPKVEVDVAAIAASLKEKRQIKIHIKAVEPALPHSVPGYAGDPP